MTMVTIGGVRYREDDARRKGLWPPKDAPVQPAAPDAGDEDRTQVPEPKYRFPFNLGRKPRNKAKTVSTKVADPGNE